MRKVIKTALGILLSLILLMLLFNFLFGYLIKTQIKRFTNNNIELEYKSSGTRILAGTIEFHDAVLHFNDVSIDSNSSIFIKSVSFDKFLISQLNLKALLFDRNFKIKRVLLSGPSINFLKDTIISRKDIFTRFLTPEVVSDKSQSAPFSFEIGELEIEQGSFQLTEDEKNDFSLGSVNLKLSNIGMDDLKALNGDAPDLNAHFDIQLGVYDIQKQLKGDAEILIDSIVYKKDNNLFELGGIQIVRLKSSSNFAESEISLFTGLISINGFSLQHLLVSKNLKFTRLTISNTGIIEKLDYFDEIKISKNKPVSKSRIFSNMINTFIIDTLLIQNFNYHAKISVTDSVNFIENLNMFVYSVRVDSNFIPDREYLGPIENSTVLSGPASMHMPEIGIDFAYDSLVYSGSGKEQKISGLHLNTFKSLFSEDNSQPDFYFTTDSVVISGLDKRKWIDSSVVELSLYIKNPHLAGYNILFGNSNQTGSPDFAPKKIVLNELNLINGSIKIEGASDEKIEAEALNVETVGLEIFLEKSHVGKTVTWKNIFTSVENSKVLIPEKLIVKTDKGIINNNNLSLEGILYSDNYKINKYPASSEKAVDTTRFFIENVKIDNFDIQLFINEKHLNIDNMVISRPSYFQYSDLVPNDTPATDSVTPILLYRRINKMLTDYFSYIHIGKFSITDADVLYQTELNNLIYHSSNSALMHEIKFGEQLSEEGLPELSIDHYEFCMNNTTLASDLVKFVSESACYNSTEDNLILINSHAEKLITNGSNINAGEIQYDVNFPKVILTQPDFTPLSGGPVSFNMIFVDDPEFYIRKSKQKKPEKLSVTEFKILPFAYIEDGIKLENGRLTICFAGENDSTTLQIGRISFESHDIYKIVGALNYHSKNKNLFSYMDFNLQDVCMQAPGTNLTIESIVYDKQSGIVSVSPIEQEIFPKGTGAKSTDSVSLIDIPKVNIEYPDLMLVDHKIKSFGAGNVLIPTVNITMESYKKAESNENQDIRMAVNDGSMRNFFRNVDFFHIDSTVFNDIGITYKKHYDSTTGTFDIHRISLLVDKLRIDSSNFDFHEKKFARDLILKLFDKEVVTADSMYRIKANNITYYYSRDKIKIDSFEVIPMYNRKDFFEKAGFQTDRMQMKFESAVAEGIDLLSIIESKKIQVRKLTLNKFHLMDHRDKHYARKENDFKKLPKQALYSLPFLISIDTVRVNNSFMLYGEYVDKSTEPGEIFFTNLNASVYNVSNYRREDNKLNSLHAYISSDIMNKARMNLSLTIPLGKDADYFWFSGSVERTDLRHFNSMTENLFGISIVRGKGGVDIPLITANAFHSQGTLNFEYKKLKLAMYNRNKAKLQRGLASGLIDFMLNGVLIKSNNPAFLRKPRTGDVYFERNEQRSFFNYIWKSTMSGLMATMGFYNKELREKKRERKSDEKIDRKDERQMNRLKE